MALTAEELAVARSWIGPLEDDATFTERYDRLGSLDSAIVESIRVQLVTLGSSPASVTLPSGLQVSTAENLRFLERQLASFISQGGTVEDETTPLGPTVTKIIRRDYR